MPVRDAVVISVLYAILWSAVCIPILSSPLGSYPVVDANWHMEWAAEFSSGNPGVYAPYFRAPLYPALLGIVFLVTGKSFIAGACLSFVLGLISILLVQKIVYLRAGRTASLVAAALMAVNGLFLFYSSTALITPLYILLLLAAFYLLDRDKPGRSGWFVLGLAVIARPSAAVLFPVTLLLLPGEWKKSWIFVLPLLAVWSVNWIHGDPGTLISSQGGINFYIGSGPDADGFTSFAPDLPAFQGEHEPAESLTDLPHVDNVWASSLRPLPSRTPPSAVSGWWFSKTLQHIRTSPLETLSLTARKILYMISPVAVPSNYDVYYYSRYSPVLGVLTGTPRLPVSGLLIWALLPGALLAGLITGKERMPVAWCVALAAAVLPFFITARFMLPVMPFMVILLVPRFLERPGKSLLSAPAGVIAGIFLALLTSSTVAAGGVNMAFHDGLAHYQQNFVEKGEILLLEAVDVAMTRDDGVDLNGTDALYNLGVIAVRRGDTESAETYWRLALDRNPGYLPAREALEGLTR